MPMKNALHSMPPGCGMRAADRFAKRRMGGRRLPIWNLHLAGALALCLALAGAPGAFAAQAPFCGDEGVWVQILGAGGAELDDAQSGASYLVWLDDQARLLVDAAPGAALRFDEAGARFEDLDAIALTHLHVDNSAGLPAFLKGSRFLARERPLTLLGPMGNAQFPGVQSFLERLIGPQGAYPYLADFLSREPSAGYRLRVREAPVQGRRRWAGFGSEHFSLTAVPVHHGSVPALAWRVAIGGQSIVFTGDFSNQRDLIAGFAKDADALVASHAVPETARGEARELHALPSQLGRIASRASVRMLILGHRMNRTRGRESQSRQAIEAHYRGPIIFANDLECWGL